MNKINILLSIAAIPLCVFAQDEGNGIVIPDETGGNDGSDQDPDGFPDKKHRSLALTIIKFHYDSVMNEVCLSLPCGVSGVSISVYYDDGTAFYGYVSSVDCIWRVELIPGVVEVVCTSDDGRVFKGNIRID